MKAAGSAGGLATANPPTTVIDQALSVSSATGITQEGTAGASRTNQPEPSEAASAALEDLSGDMDTMSLKKKRPSGAWRKRQKRLRQQQQVSDDSLAAGTESAKPDTDTSKAATETNTASSAEARIGAAMRNWGSSQGPGAASERRGSIAGKRELSGNLSPDKKDPKRQKAGTPKQASYREAAESALQVHVVNSEDTDAPLSEELAVHVRQSIVDLLDEEPSSSATPIPRFNRSGLAQGSFQVACADQASLEWLCRTASKIPPKDGISFKAVKHSELPKLHKVSVWIPGPASHADKVLGRLQKQNPTLRTGLWKVQYRDIKPNGQLLVLGVDNSSLKVLKESEGRAYFELSRVTFRLPGEAEG